MSRGVVLVAEDDLFLRPRIEADLARAGFTPVFAPTAARFTEGLRSAPAAVLLNLAARTLRYRELLAEARAAFPSVPVVGYGPHVDEALFAQALDAGCTLVVPNGTIARGAPAVVARALDLPE